MCEYMGPNGVGYTGLGERFFEEFNTRFWLRPGNKDLQSINVYIY
jgi:hypothetical protein